MQRDILFRGKRVDNGEWIFGDIYTGLNDETYINVVIEQTANSWCNKQIIIRKETVGQFTGLIDMHGKRIFEGDILRITEIRTYEGKTTIKEYETPVGWEDSAFMIKEPYDRPDPESGESTELPSDFDDWNCFLSCFAGDPEQTIPNFQLMIVGNIHDDGATN